MWTGCYVSASGSFTRTHSLAVGLDGTRVEACTAEYRPETLNTFTRLLFPMPTINHSSVPSTPRANRTMHLSGIQHVPLPRNFVTGWKDLNYRVLDAILTTRLEDSFCVEISADLLRKAWFIYNSTGLSEDDRNENDNNKLSEAGGGTLNIHSMYDSEHRRRVASGELLRTMLFDLATLKERVCDSIVFILDGKGEVNPSFVIGARYLLNDIFVWRIPRQLTYRTASVAAIKDFIAVVGEDSIPHYASLTIRGNWAAPLVRLLPTSLNELVEEKEEEIADNVTVPDVEVTDSLFREVEGNRQHMHRQEKLLEEKDAIIKDLIVKLNNRNSVIDQLKIEIQNLKHTIQGQPNFGSPFSSSSYSQFS